MKLRGLRRLVKILLFITILTLVTVFVITRHRYKLPPVDIEAIPYDTRCYGYHSFDEPQYAYPDQQYASAEIHFYHDDRITGIFSYISSEGAYIQAEYKGSYQRNIGKSRGQYRVRLEGDIYEENRTIEFNADGLLLGFPESMIIKNDIQDSSSQRVLEQKHLLPLISCERLLRWEKSINRV